MRNLKRNSGDKEFNFLKTSENTNEMSSSKNLMSFAENEKEKLFNNN